MSMHLLVLLIAANPYRAEVAAVEQMVIDSPSRHPFHIVVEPPFIVIGDESRKTVERRAGDTVRWAYEHLQSDFFPKSPKGPIHVWLFRDRQSYLLHTDLFFDEDPGTPFGYYSDTHNALIMNIATGGGTLVHEMVHPLYDANCRGCPAWLNEGLGSLFEQCAERDGQIVGLTNWRLAGLQQAIERGRLPTFAKLLSTTSYQFYNADPGTNYAQARYLLYYLQEQGLLRRFYHLYVEQRGKDPSGLETLKQVLQEKDLRAFTRRWKRFVLALRFP